MVVRMLELEFEDNRALCYLRECHLSQNVADSSWHDICGELGYTDHKTIFTFEIVIEKWPAQGT